MYYSDVFTVGFSLAGLPCLSIPFFLFFRTGVGIQIAAKKYQEEDILKFANYIKETIG
jgi:aspartyl-tRNA(Asn)/glutamyl-tRNA(Gln) amidotransferase subunit A